MGPAACCGFLWVMGICTWLAILITDKPGKAAHVFVHISDPQLGLLNQYNKDPTDWESESYMFARLVNESVQLQPKPDFIFIGGDMQNFWPNEDGLGRNENGHVSNLTIDGEDLGFHQRQDVKRILGVARSHGIPLHYTAGERDVGDKPNANDVDTMRMYSENWGPHHEVVLHENGILYVQFNSLLYVSSDMSLKTYKQEQNAWLDTQLNNLTADVKLLVVMTHIPPFMDRMEEAKGWANWNKEDREEVVTKISSKVGKNTPVLWVCGHFHGTVRNSLWQNSRAMQLRVASAAGTTMQWDGRDWFTASGAATIATKSSEDAFEEDILSGNPANVRGRLQAVETRSGMRIFRTFTDGSFEDRWVTLEELTKDRTKSIDGFFNDGFLPYSHGIIADQGHSFWYATVQVRPPAVCVSLLILPCCGFWLAFILIKVGHTYQSRHALANAMNGVATELSIYIFPIPIMLSVFMSEILELHPILSNVVTLMIWFPSYSGILSGARVGIYWLGARRSSFLGWLIWCAGSIVLGLVSVRFHLPLSVLVCCTVSWGLTVLADTHRDRLCLTFFLMITLMSLWIPHWFAELMLRGVFRGINAGKWASWILSANFVSAILPVVFMRQGRRLPAWAEGIKFLRYKELRRQRARDAQWTIQRCQALDEAYFGNPMFAEHVIVVSHAWLDTVDPDPKGEHLDMILEAIEKRLYPSSNSHVRTFARRVWRFLHLDSSPGDVLLFFDYGSLPQHPRSEDEDRLFRRALAHMNTLYQTFEVLVLDYVPEGLETQGIHLTYYEKGWCWFESRQAWLAKKLRRFSPHVDYSEQEDGIRWRDALRGDPPLDENLLTIGSEESRRELLEARERQLVKAKYFTNGKDDYELVSQLLEVAQQKHDLRKAIIHKITAEVQRILSDVPRNAALRKLGYTAKDLANEVFAESMNTALHMAVMFKSAEVVRILYESGAEAARNKSGDFPWEVYGLMLPCHDAARVAWELAAHHRDGARQQRGDPEDQPSTRRTSMDIELQLQAAVPLPTSQVASSATTVPLQL